MYISLIFVILVLFCSVLILNPSTEVRTQKEVDMRCKDTGYYLTTFICGTIAEDGAKEFVMNVTENKELPITVVDDFSAEHPVMFPSWSFNASIPGPTIRVTEGDTVRITLINPEGNKHPHSIHFHSTHDGINDGTFLSGPSGSVKPGTDYTYEFVAGPAGVYPYHWHVSPIENHINRGLYGALIIDPQQPRKPMNEMVMMMNGYDLNMEAEDEPTFVLPSSENATQLLSGNGSELELGQERGNEIYTVNGKAFEYMHNPIELEVNEPVRIYLLNMLEFDLLNNMHVHGTMFKYYPAGTEDTAPFVTDIVSLMQGDRGIMELSFPYPGLFMFHAHVTEFTDLGWMGTFKVTDPKNSTRGFA